VAGSDAHKRVRRSGSLDGYPDAADRAIEYPSLEWGGLRGRIRHVDADVPAVSAQRRAAFHRTSQLKRIGRQDADWGRAATARTENNTAPKDDNAGGRQPDSRCHQVRPV